MNSDAAMQIGCVCFLKSWIVLVHLSPDREDKDEKDEDQERRRPTDFVLDEVVDGVHVDVGKRQADELVSDISDRYDEQKIGR